MQKKSSNKSSQNKNRRTPETMSRQEAGRRGAQARWGSSSEPTRISRQGTAQSRAQTSPSTMGRKTTSRSSMQPQRIQGYGNEHYSGNYQNYGQNQNYGQQNPTQRQNRGQGNRGSMNYDQQEMGARAPMYQGQGYGNENYSGGYQNQNYGQNQGYGQSQRRTQGNRRDQEYISHQEMGTRDPYSRRGYNYENETQNYGQNYGQSTQDYGFRETQRENRLDYMSNQEMGRRGIQTRWEENEDLDYQERLAHQEDGRNIHNTWDEDSDEEEQDYRLSMHSSEEDETEEDEDEVSTYGSNKKYLRQNKKRT